MTEQRLVMKLAPFRCPNPDCQHEIGIVSITDPDETGTQEVHRSVDLTTAERRASARAWGTGATAYVDMLRERDEQRTICTSNTPADECTAERTRDCPVHRFLSGYPDAPLLTGEARIRASLKLVRQVRQARRRERRLVVARAVLFGVAFTAGNAVGAFLWLWITR